MKALILTVLFQTVFLFGQIGTIPSNLNFRLITGKQVSLSQLLEQGPVLINFWATWCAPCKKEMIFLDQFQRRYKQQGLTVLTINQDSQKSLSRVRTYVRSKNYSFLVALDPNQQLAKQMNAVLLPTTILVKSDGKILWQHQGYLPGEEKELEKQIKTSLTTPD